MRSLVDNCAVILQLYLETMLAFPWRDWLVLHRTKVLDSQEPRPLYRLQHKYYYYRAVSRGKQSDTASVGCHLN